MQGVETRYLITIHRVRTGTWTEREFARVGSKPDGSDEYGNVDVTKPREKKEEVFRYEAIHEPDIQRIVEHMEMRRRVVDR